MTSFLNSIRLASTECEGDQGFSTEEHELLRQLRSEQAASKHCEADLMRDVFKILRKFKAGTAHKRLSHRIYDFASCVCAGIGQRDESVREKRWEALKAVQNRKKRKLAMIKKLQRTMTSMLRPLQLAEMQTTHLQQDYNRWIFVVTLLGLVKMQDNQVFQQNGLGHLLSHQSTWLSCHGLEGLADGHLEATLQLSILRIRLPRARRSIAATSLWSAASGMSGSLSLAIVLVERVCASIDGTAAGGVGGDVGVSSGESNSFTSGNVLMHTPDGGVGANSTAASSGLIKLTTGWARRATCGNGGSVLLSVGTGSSGAGEAISLRFGDTQAGTGAALAAQVTCLTAEAKVRQVTNLIRKNLVIRCRKPVSSVFELLLPPVLTPSLVFIANLDSIFGTGGNYSSSSDAATGTIMYTGLDSPAYTDYGALSTNMPTFYSSGQSVRRFLLISYIKFVSTTTTTTMIEKNRRPNSSST
ncbi:hypothetical protein PHYSODRAFT_325573 [Phytophthora sojae]|uniref:Uncharacterized protein n=1 Tax=Phytophthora sojae (strain P6497) TaxID=1094619 RepID=G4YWV9_PHYSP|nr:hypothetical protein PHYSODRAFT_325573 [Phytophthora sojae]EGZ24457.1 hypothetical protein PHYSODRAFT_325573 [Phytophthora sojae]|eukprot:XP_009519745.1 hypothetical protein PHYSODRAFT_325573 [Phytophthora sojae]